MTDRPDHHEDTPHPPPVPPTPPVAPPSVAPPSATPPPLPADDDVDPAPVTERERDAVAIATGPVDPWAHRRGEPRIFAFLWTLFLLASVLGSILWHGGAPAMAEYGPAARLIAVLIGIGIGILWPVVRLSQEMPKRAPIKAGLGDLTVVLIPTQLVLWPLGLLASWPLDVVLTISALLSVWILQTAGVMTVRYATRVRAGTVASDGAGLWMCLFVGLFGWAPAAMLAGQGLSIVLPEWIVAISPLTAVYSIAGTGLRGVEAPVAPFHWIGIGLVGACGLLAWLLGIVIGIRSPIRAGSTDPAYDGRSAPE